MKSSEAKKKAKAIDGKTGKKTADKSKKPTKVKSPTDPVETNGTATSNIRTVDPALVSFEAGQIFSKYDQDGDGKLDKLEFTHLVRTNPEILGPHVKASNLSLNNVLPTEVISNKYLTHFDETSGVAIPFSDVEQHRLMGNVVSSLSDSYQSRYSKLRTSLTGKLLPKREYLLQLFRQLQNYSVEVESKRKIIERETLTDTEQILERLRAVESMRQSSIKHQVLHIEEELQAIERIVRRVEQANVSDADQMGQSSVLLTSASPSSAPVESMRGPRVSQMVELIHQFADIISNIERLANKQITIQVDFPHDDFPRETSERLEVISRCDKYLHALNVKDHMLWSSLKDKDSIQELLTEERRLNHEYAEEVAHWAEMSQTLSNQILELKQDKQIMERRNRELINILQKNNIYYMSDD